MHFPKLPFVSRSKYERVKADRRDYKRACEFKQEVLMHYRTSYNDLLQFITKPRDVKGRYEKVKFTK